MSSTQITVDLFKVGCLEAGELNNAFQKLVSSYNALCVRVDALAAPLAPDLSGYSTKTDLTGHINAGCPHRGMVKIADTGLIPPGKCALLQIQSSAIPAGSTSVTVTLSPPYAGALISALAGAASGGPVAVTSANATQVVVSGPAGSVFTLWTVGY